MNKHQYSTNHLTMTQKKEIVNLFLKNKDSRNHIDILDCNISFARKRSNLDPKTILKFLKPTSHFSLFERIDDDPITNQQINYIDLCIRSTYKEGSEIFLFSFMNPDSFNKTIKNKYKLK